MSRCCVLWVILAITFVNVNAWVGVIPPEPGTEHLGECYTKHHNIGAMKIEQEIRLEGQCAIVKCKQDRYIELVGCGSTAIAPPCKLGPGDLGKPFPHCCFEIICPENHKHEPTRSSEDLEANAL